ncbi:MAG: hypothetical protein ABSF12_20865 [Bryobacteraceae bacterium]|jgi:WD40 repeat protein
MRRTPALASILGLGLSFGLAGQEKRDPGDAVRRSKEFPEPDYVLGDTDLKPRGAQKGKVVLGSDGTGGTTFAVYGSPGLQVSSLSFSGDGKLLAVGSAPGRVDLWDVDTRKKLRTIIGGSAVALSADGRLLVKDGKDGGGIELYEVATGTLRTIPRILKRAENTVTKFTLSPDGNLLAVTANGDDDMVYDVPLGKLLTTLANTKFAQFSNDGSLLIGGNNRHLIAWSTKDWSEVRDLPRGPDYVRQIAVSPERDLVIVGGPKVAVLQRLSSGEEIARLGEGFTNFLSFNASGTLVFTYSGTSGFVVWDTSGRPYCASQRMGSTLALSADGRWLADASPTTAGAVRLWNIPGALRVCGAPEK